MRRFSLVAALGFLAAAVCFLGCATSRAGWVALAPEGRYAPDDVNKSSKTVRGVTVSAKLLQGNSRYLARIEIQNGRKKSSRGPDGLALQDGDGVLQPLISAEDLKQEVRRSAASEAAYSLDAWPRYYYAPRRVYYGRGRYRTAYAGPFYHDDWFERRWEAERILENADKAMATVDADYLKVQDIPAGATLSGFAQFSKKPQKGTPAAPLKLSLTVDRRVFEFAFTPLPPNR